MKEYPIIDPTDEYCLDVAQLNSRIGEDGGLNPLWDEFLKKFDRTLLNDVKTRELTIYWCRLPRGRDAVQIQDIAMKQGSREASLEAFKRCLVRVENFQVYDEDFLEIEETVAEWKPRNSLKRAGQITSALNDKELENFRNGTITGVGGILYLKSFR